MILDCHTHISQIYPEASVQDLLKSMDSSEIDQSFVFAGSILNAPNKWILQQIKDYPDRLKAVATVNLTNITAKPGEFGIECGNNTIRDMLDTLNSGAIALKLYTGYEYFSPSSSKVRQVIDMMLLYTNIKTVIFHCGDCCNNVNFAKLKYAHPLDVDDIAVDYPQVNFVIAHLSYPWITDTAEVCYKNPNVYTDISGFVYGDFSPQDTSQFDLQINNFIKIAPPAKLLFGTDFPISNQKSYIKQFKHSFLDPSILSINTIKCFNL